MRERPGTHIVVLSSTLDLIETCLVAIEHSTEANTYDVCVGSYGTSEEFSDRLMSRSLSPKFVMQVDDSEPFSFSKMNNDVCEVISGQLGFNPEREFFVFLNDDVYVRDDWLHQMRRCWIEIDCSCVGMKLVYPPGHKDAGRVQHAGVVRGSRLAGSHRGLLCDPSAPALKTPPYLPIWAVTGACMMVRAIDFLDVRGFDEQYKGECQDIDLCMKLTELREMPAGLVQSTYCFHDEGATRGGRREPEEMMATPELARASDDQTRFRWKWKEERA